MTDAEESGLAYLIGIVIGAVLVFLVFLIVFQAKATEDCAERGFAKHLTTWNFRVFCIGYDGAVHPVVQERK